MKELLQDAMENLGRPLRCRGMMSVSRELTYKLMWTSGQSVVVRLDNGQLLETVTRSVPWLLGGHTWVVMVEGIAGGYALDRVRASPEFTLGNGFIRCNTCDLESYHPSDIANRYCGCCHVFHTRRPTNENA